MLSKVKTSLLILIILASALFGSIPQAQPVAMLRESAKPAPTSLDEALYLSLFLRDGRKVDFSKVL